jgi:hypothetical protein
LKSAKKRRIAACVPVRFVCAYRRLNDRATADAIRERLNWLLDGAGDGMERVLLYSGHGAQLPLYNPVGEIDHIDECLVLYDFAWTKQTPITDDDFYHLYVDLPYEARFFAIFDCCHSGGMTRDGVRKIRGITLPDDIRHRMLEWDARQQMWRERKLPPLNDDFGGTPAEKREFMGANQATLRLGRAMRLRQVDKRNYERLVSHSRPPYLPVLLEACRQDQFSYEYRHGVHRMAHSLIRWRKTCERGHKSRSSRSSRRQQRRSRT